MSKIEGVFENTMSYLIKLIRSKPISAIKDGFILTMPAIIIGAFVLLIGNFPINGWSDIMTSVFGEKWSAPLNQVSGATMGVLSLIVVFSISYAYVKNDGHEGVAAGILGIVSFLIVTNAFVITEAGELVGGVIPKVWTGGHGIIAAVLIGLLTGSIYGVFVNKKIIIKMPKSVPSVVANTFIALIPAIAIVVVSMVIYIMCDAVKGVSLTEIIYKIL